VGIVVFILAALFFPWWRGKSRGWHARLPYRLSVDVQRRQSIYDTGKLFFDDIAFGRYLFIIHYVISGICAFWNFFNTIVASPDGCRASVEVPTSHTWWTGHFSAGADDIRAVHVF